MADTKPTPSLISDPLSHYQRMLNEGELRPDPDQQRLVRRLHRLHLELMDYPEIKGHGRGLSIGSWRLANLFGTSATPPRGLYMVGGVGRGKSMLMDIFFKYAPVKSKIRIHFHEFMRDVHARLKRWRAYTPKERVKAGGRAGDDDPIPPVASELAAEATLLCFDEFQVTDIADAMVLSRLFGQLFELGVIVVATSNRPPEDLYKDGLNRQLFLPFIDLLKERLDLETLDGPTDYRLDRLKGVETYLTPVNQETTDQLSAAFFKLTDRSVDDRHKVPTATLTVHGRALFVPKSARGVCVFSFKRLCGSALGPSDYLAVAQAYHTLFLVAVPQMGPENRNEAKRFVTLIDALYENGVKLLLSAEVEASELYKAGDGSFEFDRTVSRLEEMQSTDYLARGHGSARAEAAGAVLTALEDLSEEEIRLAEEARLKAEKPISGDGD